MPETVTEIAKIWERTLARIQNRINDSAVYDVFFGHTYIETIRGKTIVVAADTMLAVKVLDSKYKDLVITALADVTGTDYDVEFVQFSGEGKASEKTESEAKSSFFKDARLNPQMTFENFVVGNFNRQVYQAALLISRDPGQTFNPLLIYSDSGLGKTHILHAIGNAVKQERPMVKVLCTSASDFFDEYTKTMSGYDGSQAMVRWFKSEVDVLLLDDIQLLTNKKKTMELFFVIFADLVARGKQIVITSDQHPNRLDGLDDRLKTRFAQGLVLSLERPDLVTCEEILRRKIAANGIDLEDFEPEVISFLASRFSRNVRELEGALTRLLFYTVNFKPSKHIDMAIATEAIQGLVAAQDNDSKLTEARIIATVADYYNLTQSQLTGKIRTYQIALARHIAMYLDKTLLNTPFTKIGYTFGGKDHATVMKGVEKVENALRTDPDMQKAISELKAKLGR